MKHFILFLIFSFALSRIYSQTPIQQICAGYQHSYTIENPKPELTYIWGIYNNTGQINSVKPDNTQIEILWKNTIGTDSLWLVAIDNSCQSDTTKLIVKRLPVPTVEFEQTKVCYNEALPIKFEGNAPFSFEYSINGTIKTISEINQTLFYLNETAGNVVLKAIMDKNCTNSVASGTINAEIMQKVQNLSLKNEEINDTVCINTISSYEISNFNSNSNYFWGISSNSGTIFENNNTNININWNNSLVHGKVWVVEENQYQCKSDTLYIAVEKVELPNIQFIDSIFCFGEELKLETSANFPITINYTFQNKNYSENFFNNNIILSNKLSGIYTLIEITDRFCTNLVSSQNNKATIDIRLNDLSFENQIIDTVYLNEKVRYSILDKSENTNLFWNVWQAEILSENPSFSDSILIYWNKSGWQEVKVHEKTQNNCTGIEITQNIFVKNQTANDKYIELKIPNVFTPNDDGKNDYFTIEYNQKPENFMLTILNRWGKKVFETQNIDEKWNGELNGRKINEGIYYFEIQYKSQNKLENKKGFFHVYL